MEYAVGGGHRGVAGVPGAGSSEAGRPPAPTTIPAGAVYSYTLAPQPQTLSTGVPPGSLYTHTTTAGAAAASAAPGGGGEGGRYVYAQLQPTAGAGAGGGMNVMGQNGHPTLGPTVTYVTEAPVGAGHGMLQVSPGGGVYTTYEVAGGSSNLYQGEYQSGGYVSGGGGYLPGGYGRQ